MVAQKVRSLWLLTSEKFRLFWYWLCVCSK